MSMDIEDRAEAAILLAHHKATFCLGSALTGICGNNPGIIIHVSIHCVLPVRRVVLYDVAGIQMVHCCEQ